VSGLNSCEIPLLYAHRFLSTSSCSEAPQTFRALELRSKPYRLDAFSLAGLFSVSVYAHFPRLNWDSRELLR
jgi:hypothetical protein